MGNSIIPPENPIRYTLSNMYKSVKLIKKEVQHKYAYPERFCPWQIRTCFRRNIEQVKRLIKDNKISLPRSKKKKALNEEEVSLNKLHPLISIAIFNRRQPGTLSKDISEGFGIRIADLIH